jgi:hypothetical protein
MVLLDSNQERKQAEKLTVLITFQPYSMRTFQHSIQHQSDFHLWVHYIQESYICV